MRFAQVRALLALVWLSLPGMTVGQGRATAPSSMAVSEERSAAESPSGVLVAQGGTRTRGGATAAAGEVLEAVERGIATQARVAASQARALGAPEEAVGSSGTGVLAEAMHAYAEATGAAIEVLAAVNEVQEAQRSEDDARWLQVEVQAEGPRHTAPSLETLRRQKPMVDKPPAGVSLDDALWRDYVSYFERRLGELAGEVTLPECLKAALKPPLTWRSYWPLHDRFQAARKFQKRVTDTLASEVGLRPEERVWLRDVPEPLVTENMGLWHERPCVLTFADQFVVDRRSLGGKGSPRILTFSNKQRDFSAMDEADVSNQVSVDAEEARKKYSGVVEIRRRRHPLFGRKVTVSKVYLVYDGSTIEPRLRQEMRDAAARMGVEVRFHES